MVIRALALLLLLPAVASAAQPGELVVAVLPNGLEVYVLARPDDPVVATQLWYRVGSANEDPAARGMAHLFEHLMFGETTTRSKEDSWSYHHRYGGSENAYTMPDETVYVSEIVPEAAAGVIEREADRMAHLVIGQDSLENEKKIVLEELRMRGENSPLTRVLVAAQQAELGKHPYAYDPAGTREDTAAATVEAARRFYESYYRPANAHLVIVGNVDPAATIARAEAAFAPIAGGGKTPPEVPALTEWTYPPQVELKEDLPPVEVAVIGFPLPPADSPDRDAIDLLSQLLSGNAVNPFREILVVRRHKAIEARCETISLRRGGVLLFATVHLPYRRESTAFRLMDEARQDLSRLEWLSEERVRSAKRALRLRVLEASYFASSVADTIGRARWWQGDARRGLDRIARIEAVTREDVAAAYRRYVGSPRPLRLYVKPQRVPLYVRLFGWLYPLVAR